MRQEQVPHPAIDEREIDVTMSQGFDVLVAIGSERNALHMLESAAHQLHLKRQQHVVQVLKDIVEGARRITDHSSDLSCGQTCNTIAFDDRLRRIEDELPTVLEFLSLCLAAGEGLREALRRVGEVGTRELTAELRRAVLASGTGSSLSDALAGAAQRLDVPPLTRATDHLVSAIERGAPLSQVLQNQAADVREEAKRRLIEAAGRKEIAMLLPLVFLLLPLSVLFAVFPGIVMLRLGIG